MIKIRIIRADGTEEDRMIPHELHRAGIRNIIGTDCMSAVNLRNGRVMFVDDNELAMKKLDNAKASALYHSICGPGKTRRIVGDVVIIDESAQ